MAYTQDQYDKLIEAISQGAKAVKYGDKEVIYHSLSEMLKLKKDMETDLGLGTGKKVVYPTFNKGLNSGAAENAEWQRNC